MTLLFTCILMLCIGLNNCHTIRDTNKLLKDKLTDYNKNTRPTHNQSNPTYVYYNLDIVYIQEFDEVQQKMTFIAVPTLGWVDEEIKWNPADYGGISSIVAPSGLFWIPNMALANSAGEKKPLGDDWQMVRYFAEGTAVYSPGVIISAVCGADITYYPYDKHTCVLSFSPQGYNPSEIYLIIGNEEVGRNYYIENGGWDFVDSGIKVVNSEYYIELTVSITLQRKPRYAIINVILPIIFLAYLSNVVFYIPADCGERISYSITVLLAVAVYLTIVGDNLPKTSSPMSYFSYYLLTMLVTSILITMGTIFNLRIYHSDETDPVTGIWAKIASCFKCGIRNKRKKYAQNRTDADRKHGRENDTDRKHERENGYEIQDNIHHVVISNMYKRNLYVPRPQEARRNGRHLDIRDETEMSPSDDDSDRVRRFSWKDVSVAFDKIFFVVFFVILTAATVIFIVVIATEQSN